MAVMDLDDAFAIFDTYLDGPADRPVGVAVSGGGDSVALLYALATWGRRPLEVFCVDHGLNPDSGRWTRTVADHAGRTGAGFTALHWTGEKPKTGLSAKARMARHALLAEAARSKGLSVICLAHTHDDIAEAHVMAEEGSSVGAPALWGPSPAWPKGRGVYLFRPFIGRRRAELREYLSVRGISWIDDPANENMASARVRARQSLAGQVMTSPGLGVYLQPVRLYQDLPYLLDDANDLSDFGMIAFDEAVFWSLPEAIARRRLAAAVVSAGGGDRLPRRESLENLRYALEQGETATLCGARVQSSGGHIEIVREAGELERRAVSPLWVPAGQTAMWDGRFEITVSRAVTLYPSAHVRAGLPDNDRKALHALPAALRPVLPAVIPDGEGAVLPVSTESGGTEFACWVMPRFLAACGVFACESDLSRLWEKPL